MLLHICTFDIFVALILLFFIIQWPQKIEETFVRLVFLLLWFYPFSLFNDLKKSRFLKSLVVKYIYYWLFYTAILLFLFIHDLKKSRFLCFWSNFLCFSERSNHFQHLPAKPGREPREEMKYFPASIQANRAESLTIWDKSW